MRKILERCPSCGDRLDATQLSCSACDTVIQGTFSPCAFCKLSPGSLHFLEIFVKNRGNLKEMERELGQSYPTLRSRLNAVIEELGFEVSPGEEEDELAAHRRKILGQLDRGEISAAEAAELLSS
jgi:hypothetical protein